MRLRSLLSLCIHTLIHTHSFDHIMEIERNRGCIQSPKAVFRLRVAFDIFKIGFCWFGTVSLFAFILLMTHTKDTTQSAYLWGCGIVECWYGAWMCIFDDKRL
eukprot:480461_1